MTIALSATVAHAAAAAHAGALVKFRPRHRHRFSHRRYRFFPRQFCGRWRSALFPGVRDLDAASQEEILKDRLMHCLGDLGYHDKVRAVVKGRHACGRIWSSIASEWSPVADDDAYDEPEAAAAGGTGDDDDDAEPPPKRAKTNDSREAPEAGGAEAQGP